MAKTKAQKAASKKRQLEANKAYIRAVKATLSCLYCPEDNPLLLDFHHRDPDTKEFSIGQHHRGRKTRKQINDEMAKCDAVCVKCHRLIEAGYTLVPYHKQYLG